MKVTTTVVPQPAPPKVFTIQLTQEEAGHLRTLLVYFETTTKDHFSDTPEYRQRERLVKLVGGSLLDALKEQGAEFIFGL